MSAPTLEYYVEAIQGLMDAAAKDGYQLYIDTGQTKEHMFPAANPCADGSVPTAVPAWKKWVRGVAESVATDCRCCNGLRIFTAAVIGTVIGAVL